MKKNINLFSQDQIKQKVTNFMHQMTAWNIAFLIVLIVALAGVTGFLIYQSGVNATNEKSLDNLKVFVTQNELFDRKLSYFIFKYDHAQKYLKDDAKGYTYYTALKNLVLSNAPLAVITSFQIDNQKVSNFTIQFVDYSQAIEFIRYAESPEFLSQFEYVKISPISLSGAQPTSAFTNEAEISATPTNLTIQFHAQFKTIP